MCENSCAAYAVYLIMAILLPGPWPEKCLIHLFGLYINLFWQSFKMYIEASELFSPVLVL